MTGGKTVVEAIREKVNRGGSPGKPDRDSDPGNGGLDKGTIEALAAFRYVFRRFLYYSEDRARAAGITPQQYQLLLAVYGQAGRDWASVRELAESLQIQHHAAVGLVSRCERARLVRREPSEEDRRQVRVFLTRKGIDVTSGIARQNFAELKDMMLTLELLFQQGAVTMPDAAAIVQAVAVDREEAAKTPRRSAEQLIATPTPGKAALPAVPGAA